MAKTTKSQATAGFQILDAKHPSSVLSPKPYVSVVGEYFNIPVLFPATKMSARFTSLTRVLAPRAVQTTRRSVFHTAVPYQAVRASSNMSLTVLDASQHPNLPQSSHTLFAAKQQKKVSFEEIAKAVGREEVAVAALFYGQAKASPEDIKNLSEYFGIDHAQLETQLSGFPDRGKSIEMPPKEPLIYRFYEIVQNYGYAYKAVLNEKFGDGIMSAIAFSTSVEKEVDKDGVAWVNIKMRGKWLPFTRF